MGQGLHMGGGQGAQPRTGDVPRYTGPTIDPASLIDANGFVSQQAYVDAAYILINSDTIDTVYKASGSVSVADAVNGADEAAKINGQDNTLPTPYNLDFNQYKPSAAVVAAVAAAKQFDVAVKTFKHPDPSVRAQFVNPQTGRPNLKAILAAVKARQGS